VPVSETLNRIAVALVGIPVAVAAIRAGGGWLAVLLAAAAGLTAWEIARMAARSGARPLVPLAVGGAVAVVAAVGADPGAGLANPLPAAVLALLVIAAATAAIWTRGVEGEPLAAVSLTVFAAGYASLLAFALPLRHLPGVSEGWHGAALLLAPVVLTWASDTFAYFGGRLFGRRKLIPRVSPGKTVAGAVSAVLGSVAVGAAYALVLARFPSYRPSLAEGALLGLLVSVSAQVGDLAESLFKRDAGVKDSGTVFGGHGGAFDRFDSLLFTLPLGYAFLRFVVGV
jgi:phosphatidate cytidylyltransferase